MYYISLMHTIEMYHKQFCFEIVVAKVKKRKIRNAASLAFILLLTTGHVFQLSILESFFQDDSCPIHTFHLSNCCLKRISTKFLPSQRKVLEYPLGSHSPLTSVLNYCGLFWRIIWSRYHPSSTIISM